MYRQIGFSVLPTERVDVFRTILTASPDFSLYSIHRLNFITDANCVLCEVKLNIYIFV